jgi:flagellar biosynthesis protein FlhF
MLKRRQTESSQSGGAAPASGMPLTPSQQAARPQAAAPLRVVGSERQRSEAPAEPVPERHQALRDRINAPRRDPPVLREEIRVASPGRHDPLEDGPTALAANPRERNELLGELRSMRELIDERFGMLAFMERLQRDPRQATLSQKLFDVGLSPALVRKLVQSLPSDAPDELAWAAGVLERNLLTDERELPIEDHEGVFALIGATGVGKTTSTAKLAAAFATRHGASQLGLITLDAYRVAAHEQLRTYGRILGVPVHTAHDRASLEDLLELLAGKKLVLIDTAGMAQRDVRTRELLEMLQHRAIKKVLVVNAAAQGETVEDVMVAYGVAQCFGVIVSKLDEAVKLGPALDALIRHRAKVVGVANGQRVPEDWHRLSAQALVQRALRGGGGASWRLDASEVNLMFAATLGAGYPGPQGNSARQPA